MLNTVQMVKLSQVVVKTDKSVFGQTLCNLLTLFLWLFFLNIYMRQIVEVFCDESSLWGCAKFILFRRWCLSAFFFGRQDVETVAIVGQKVYIFVRGAQELGEIRCDIS